MLVEGSRNGWFRQDWGVDSRMETLKLHEVLWAEDSDPIVAD